MPESLRDLIQRLMRRKLRESETMPMDILEAADPESASLPPTEGAVDDSAITGVKVEVIENFAPAFAFGGVELEQPLIPVPSPRSTPPEFVVTSRPDDADRLEGIASSIVPTSISSLPTANAVEPRPSSNGGESSSQPLGLLPSPPPFVNWSTQQTADSSNDLEPLEIAGSVGQTPRSINSPECGPSEAASVSDGDYCRLAGGFQEATSNREANDPHQQSEPTWNSRHVLEALEDRVLQLETAQFVRGRL